MDRCLKCGEEYELCPMCRAQYNHQRCVLDDMCHECKMKRKWPNPKPCKCWNPIKSTLGFYYCMKCGKEYDYERTTPATKWKG